MRIRSPADAQIKIPLANHANAIEAALRRGVSYSILAGVFGVTPQGVQLFCSRRGWAPGERTRRQTRKVGFECRHCGRPTMRVYKRRYNLSYCSRQCKAATVRLSKLDNVVEAIGFRLRGRQWPTIARNYGCAVQSLQKAIFLFLHANGIYSKEAMDAIWLLEEGPHSKGPPKYNWLVNQAGPLLAETSLRRYRNPDHRSLVAGLLRKYVGPQKMGLAD